MYTQIKEIRKINKYDLDGERIVSWTDKGIEFFEGGRSERKINTKAVNAHFYHYNVLIEKDFEGNKTFVSEDGYLCFNSGLDSVKQLIDKYSFLHVFFSEDYKKSYLGLYSLSNRKSIWKLKVSADFSFQCDGENLFLFDNSKFDLYSLDDGCLKWSFKTEDVSNRNLGIMWMSPETDKVVIAIKYGSIHFLSKGTGESLTSDEKPRLMEPQDDNFYNFSMPFLHHKVSQKLFWLTNQSLFEIDLQTQTSNLIKNFRDAPREEQWRFMTSTIHVDHIYFTADLGWEYVTASRLGVMDAFTGEVLWQKQLEKTGGLPNAPKVSDKRLFVLTAKGDLYIFEKEKIV